MIVMMFVIGLFILLGIILINGKGSSLIAGYNTMPPEEKEKYDTVSLCKFMGKMMFALSFSMLFWVFSEAYEINWLFAFGLVLFIGIIIFMLLIQETDLRSNNYQSFR
ncbi:DUF3784 domain-containing protein [Virgibacillus salexigens]|uniref:DUF3784 domain-containing protein n=1 Tax=Virgibacillus salexigens TaxID=61016 RepID=UPI001F38D603|nr:DUF3784 domain-containing protein [Virgibacillus salexigens]